mmetsp:Transcript_110493/g.276647  ORF Transcript_110493/g.276647 Transcript_110493/m.276647 type:complete len:226 (+) Transcript_110493:469-1146(+)
MRPAEGQSWRQGLGGLVKGQRHQVRSRRVFVFEAGHRDCRADVHAEPLQRLGREDQGDHPASIREREEPRHAFPAREFPLPSRGPGEPDAENLWRDDQDRRRPLLGQHVVPARGSAVGQVQGGVGVGLARLALRRSHRRHQAQSGNRRRSRGGPGGRQAEHPRGLGVAAGAGRAAEGGRGRIVELRVAGASLGEELRGTARCWQARVHYRHRFAFASPHGVLLGR